MVVRYCTASWLSIFLRQWIRKSRVQERSANPARRARPGLPVALSTWSEQLVSSLSLQRGNSKEQCQSAGVLAVIWRGQKLTKQKTCRNVQYYINHVIHQRTPLWYRMKCQFKVANSEFGAQPTPLCDAFHVSPAAEFRLLRHRIGQLPPSAGWVVQHHRKLVEDIFTQSANVYFTLLHLRYVSPPLTKRDTQLLRD